MQATISNNAEGPDLTLDQAQENLPTLRKYLKPKESRNDATDLGE